MDRLELYESKNDASGAVCHLYLILFLCEKYPNHFNTQSRDHCQTPKFPRKPIPDIGPAPEGQDMNPLANQLSLSIITD
jgi:hypothetical protein